MKKIINLTSISLLLILLTGCPYESTIPIDKPFIKINTEILGSWLEQVEQDNYIITKQDKYTYNIQVNYKNKTDKQVDNYSAFTSIINGSIFLNVYSKKENSKYCFFKIEIPDDSTMLAFPVSEKLKQEFKNSEEIKKYIENNMKNNDFFEPAVSFERVGIKQKKHFVFIPLVVVSLTCLAAGLTALINK